MLALNLSQPSSFWAWDWLWTKYMTLSIDTGEVKGISKIMIQIIKSDNCTIGIIRTIPFLDQLNKNTHKDQTFNLLLTTAKISAVLKINMRYYSQPTWTRWLTHGDQATWTTYYQWGIISIRDKKLPLKHNQQSYQIYMTTSKYNKVFFASWLILKPKRRVKGRHSFNSHTSTQNFYVDVILSEPSNQREAERAV